MPCSSQVMHNFSLTCNWWCFFKHFIKIVSADPSIIKLPLPCPCQDALLPLPWHQANPTVNTLHPAGALTPALGTALAPSHGFRSELFRKRKEGHGKRKILVCLLKINSSD